MSSRTPGEGRYSQFEREQRWRLLKAPLDLEGGKEILDLYLTGTRLRLRKVMDNGEVVYKFAQKVRASSGDPEVVKITNIYLSSSEYGALASLPSRRIRKNRFDHTLGDRTFAIDVFTDRHEGLVLAEFELGQHDRKITMPSFAVEDVSNDDRFSGGALAQATDQEIRSLLAGP